MKTKPPRKAKPFQKNSSASRSSKEKNPRELLYGILPVQSALQHQKRTLFELYIKEHATSGRIEALQKKAEELGVAVRPLKSKAMEALCPAVLHQGVVLSCSPLLYADMAALEKNPKKNPIFLALDQIEDPHNLGAIIRSCSFFQVSGLIIPRHGAASLTPTVSKASAGTAEHFPVVAVPNLSQFLKSQKKQGYWIVGLDEQAEQSLGSLHGDRSYILVVGNEGRGLRRLVQSLCDWCVSIPGNPQVASLNVSNAAAIALYHLTNRSS